jgi:hypothetical protein
MQNRQKNNPTNKVPNPVVVIHPTVQDSYGNMYQLLDSIFSLLHAERGSVTEELLRKLETQLELARKAWNNLKMSETPKWHVLLCHAVSLLRQSQGGLVQIGESHIERFHQIRERDRQRMCRQRNRIIQKQSQAKFQNLRVDSNIKKEQASVAEGSSRKLKRRLKEERGSADKEDRDRKRAAVESPEIENPMVARVLPRDPCKEDARLAMDESDA